MTNGLTGKRASVCGATVLLLVLWASTGYGYDSVQYSAPAALGKTVNAGTTNCFYEDYGREENYYCSGAQYWSLPLTFDQSAIGGYVGATIQVFAPNTSATVGCYQYSVQFSGAENATVYASNTVYPAQFGTTQWLTPSTVYDPANVVQVICMVSLGATVNYYYYQ